MLTILVLGVLALAALAAFRFAPTGLRTLAVNAVVGLPMLAGLLLDYLVGVNWREILPPEIAPLAVLGVNVANILLRAATTGPLGHRPDGEGVQ